MRSFGGLVGAGSIALAACLPARTGPSPPQRAATAMSSPTPSTSPPSPAAKLPSRPLEPVPSIAPPPAAQFEIAFSAEPLRLPSSRTRAEGRVLASTQDEELSRWNIGGCSNPAHPANRAGYHPAPRVRVDLRVLSGALPERSHSGPSSQRLLAQARSHGYWPFRLCFEDGLRADPALEGRTTLRVRIASAGAAEGASLLKTELQLAGVADCLATEAGRLRFDPGPGGRVTAEIVVSLWPGDAPVPSIPEAADERPSSVDLAAATAVLGAQRESVSHCYRRGLREDARLWGRIELLVELDARGSVTRIEQLGSHFPDPRVVTCIARAVRDAGFHPAVRSGGARFVYAVRLGNPPELKDARRP